MTHNARHTKPTPSADHDRPARERDGEPERERRPRVGAAQLAAPKSRTWRRAGRFASTRQ